MRSASKRTVIVTGGSAGGIGHATAVEFAKLGCRVAITGRDQVRLDRSLADLLRASPSQPASEDDYLTLKVDLEDEKQVDQVVEQVVDKFRRLDVLVNNAGFNGNARGHLLDEAFYDLFKSVLQVNLHAPTRLAQLAALYLMEAPEGGVIVNVSLVADTIAFTHVAYSVTKAGLSMLTKTLANNFKGKNVRCRSRVDLSLAT